jgi:Holliday junction resolvasome RuvABC endonuclease subunit
MWTWDLSKVKGGRPQKLLHLATVTAKYFRENRVDYAFCEAPLNIAVMRDIGATDETVQMLRSIIAIIELCCAYADIPVSMWDVQAARRAVTGRGTYPRGTAKAEIMRYCKMLGYAPEGDDQCDALIGWLAMSANLNPRLQAALTPLFGAVPK